MKIWRIAWIFEEKDCLLKRELLGNIFLKAFLDSTISLVFESKFFDRLNELIGRNLISSLLGRYGLQTDWVTFKIALIVFSRSLTLALKIFFNNLSVPNCEMQRLKVFENIG